VIVDIEQQPIGGNSAAIAIHATSLDHRQQLAQRHIALAPPVERMVGVV
jgi:hypothetical protein